MKKLIPLTLLSMATFGLAPLTHAQDSDQATDSAIKQATEAAKKMGMKMPDVKQIMEDNDKEEAKEKAAKQAAVDAPGPVVLPAWTPKTPQFTPAGPVAKKLIEGEPKIALSGTSTLTPAELADAWEAEVADQKINHVRNNISSNGTLTTILFLTTRTDPREEVRLEARRAPDEKITRVSMTSPLPVAKTDDEDE